jgi:two-component system, LuxR family, response regulator FixJ
MLPTGTVHYAEHPKVKAERLVRRSCWHAPCNCYQINLHQRPELTETTMHQKQSVVPAPKVFVVDNDPSTRQSLAWLLESVNLSVEAFETAEAFLVACTPDQPGCLVLDLRLPGMSGVVLQEELVRVGIQLPVIMITGYADVPTAVRVLKRGAFDFFEKPLADDMLLDRIREAITRDARQRRARAVRDLLTARLACLTVREREIFNQIVHGKANKVVAIEFGISEKTVEAHRARVMHKLCAGSLAELVRMDLATSEFDPWLMPGGGVTDVFTARLAPRHLPV